MGAGRWWAQARDVVAWYGVVYIKKRMSNVVRRLTITHSPLSPAVRTRLELATSGVTGRHSNQLNYRTRNFVGGNL